MSNENTRRFVSVLTFDHAEHRDRYMGILKAAFSDTYIHHVKLDTTIDNKFKFLEVAGITKYRELFKKSVGVDTMVDIYECVDQDKLGVVVCVDTTRAAFIMSATIVRDHLSCVADYAKSKTVLTQQQLETLSAYKHFLDDYLKDRPDDIIELRDGFESIKTGIETFMEQIKISTGKLMGNNPKYLYICTIVEYLHEDTLSVCPDADREAYRTLMISDTIYRKLGSTLNSLKSLIEKMNKEFQHMKPIPF